MTKVQQAVEDLLSVLRQTEEYTEYRCQLEKLKMQPELHHQVDIFRTENFELQNLTPEDQLLQKTEQFEEKYRDLRENPLVMDFLAAELAFCRMMQETHLKITEGLPFE